jgi:hypothetical protein
VSGCWLIHFIFSTRLECLCLNGCQAITDHSLKVVADKHGERCVSSRHLEASLDISNNLIFLLSLFSLRTFEIFGCFNVSAAAIKRLGQKCPNLKTLNLGQCYKVRNNHVLFHNNSLLFNNNSLLFSDNSLLF